MSSAVFYSFFKSNRNHTTCLPETQRIHQVAQSRLGLGTRRPRRAPVDSSEILDVKPKVGHDMMISEILLVCGVRL